MKLPKYPTPVTTHCYECGKPVPQPWNWAYCVECRESWKTEPIITQEDIDFGIAVQDSKFVFDNP